MADPIETPAWRKAMQKPAPHKLLSLDGGGIRGLITIEILAHIERVLRKKMETEGRLHAGQDFVLADYFDYIGGTSTGAIIAACLSWGMSVEQIRKFYVGTGPSMFAKAGLLERLTKYKFESDALSVALKAQFGEADLGTENLKTLLLMVLRNATTDSPWPLSNNPRAKYNDISRPDCNLRLPLWKLIRASTAAPTYFPPEAVEIKGRDFVFMDGGITMYNNPAFQMFLMATLGPYRLEWETGEDKMLLVSVGTGTYADINSDLDGSGANYLGNAKSLPTALMNAALAEQDLLCRTFGKCLAGGVLDREVGSLRHDPTGLLPQTVFPIRSKLFTYLRYNTELTDAGLEPLGLSPRVDAKSIRKLDSIDQIGSLMAVGEAVGRANVMREHFQGF